MPQLSRVGYMMSAPPMGPVYRDPGTNDLMTIEVLGSTPIVTAPTNNVDPNGRVVALTFKGMAGGLSRDHTQVSFQVDYPGYDSSGNSTTVTETVYLNGWLRMPFPKDWASATFSVGDIRSNRVSSKGYMYRLLTSAAPTLSTVAPTTGGTAGVTDTGILSDGYKWLYLGNPTDNTSVTEDAFSTYMETTSGGNTTIYGVLSHSIPTGAIIRTHNVGANTYGTSNSSVYVNATKTHSQTLAPVKPILVPLTISRQLVGNTLHVETAVWHHAARYSRPVACHKFIVKNGSGTVQSTTVVTSTSVSTLYTGGNTVQVFSADIDLSSTTDNADYYLFEESYPWRGAAYTTETNGYGTSTLATNKSLTGNVGKYIPFSRKSSPTIRYAYVDGVGAAPAISTDAATARNTPYSGIRQAALALQSANSSVVDSTCIIRVKDKGSAYDTGWGNTASAGNMQSGLTYGSTPLIIEIDPLATPGSVNFQPTAGVATADKQGPNRAIIRGIKFTPASSSSPAIDNVAATGIATAGTNDFAVEQRYENCQLVCTSAQNPINRPGMMWFANCTLDDVNTKFGAGSGRTVTKYMAGCSIRSVNRQAQIAPVALIGCQLTRTSTFSSPDLGAVDARAWGEATGSLVENEFNCYMFNTWPRCLLSTGVSCFNGTSSGTAKERVERGAFIMNLVEAYSTDGTGNPGTGSAKGGTYSGDSNATPISEIHFAWNTIVGDGPNIGYNNAGFAYKYLFGGFNWMDDINHKGDYRDDTTSSETKIGNLLLRYHVDWSYNFIPGTAGSFNYNAGPGNNIGEAWGQNDLRPTSVTPLGRNFTADKSFFGSPKTGDGTYTPTTGNGAIGMITTTNLLAFPKGLNGASYVTGDAVGAYPKA